MTRTDQDWQPRLVALVDQLAEDGALRSPAWRAAFEAVPRHVFVPMVLTNGEAVSGDDPAHREAWLDLAYTDTSLVTQHQEHPSIKTVGDRPLLVSTSSSTMPSLMAAMLEALDIQDGQRVLEIGTGTGYNVALLCHRLGADNVVSVEIDPGLVAAAKDHLDSLGYHPTLVAGDGAAGVAECAPYDRIIATAAVADIPLAWIEQLAPGGKILANVRGELAGGTLCLLTKDGHDDEVIGPVLPLGGHFMWLRPDAANPLRSPEPAWVRSDRDAASTTTPLDPAGLIEDDGFRFLLQLQLRGARGFRRAQVYDPRTRTTRQGFTIETADGSHAEVIAEPDPDCRYPVVQVGQCRSWDHVEVAHQLWQHLGRPDPSRFGIVANATTQFVWHDTDDDWYRWPLPLV